MSQAKAKTKKANEDRKPNHAVPSQGKKFANADKAIAALEVVVAGGEIQRRSKTGGKVSTTYPPARLFSDPIDYWRCVLEWSNRMQDVASEQIITLDEFTIVDEDGKELTGKDARQYAAKLERKRYADAANVERSKKNPAVLKAIGDDSEAVTDILARVMASGDSDKMAELIAAAQAKLDADGKDGE